MKNLGSLLTALSLIAMTPSHAKAPVAKQKHKADESAWFKDVKQCITFVSNVKGSDYGDGSFRNPYADIQTAVNNAAEGCIIYVISTGKVYEIDTDANAIELKKGQRLIGSSMSLKLKGKEIPPLTRERPVLQISNSYSDSFAIVLNDSTQVAGFMITGSSGQERAIGGLPSSGMVEIRQNHFKNLLAAVFLVEITPSASLTVLLEGNKFETVFNNVINLTGTQTMRVRGNTFDTGKFGLFSELTEGAAARCEQNSFSNYETGLEIFLQNGSTACVERNIFSNNSAQGFFAQGTETSDYSADVNCLQFFGNQGTGNGGNDFIIRNGSNSAELFQVALCDNKGSGVTGNVTFLQSCSGCISSK